jgi:hypothetical protein
MDPIKFGTYTNITLVLVVTLYGIYWLFKPPKHNDLAYRYRAYCYWWCSWLAWVIAWTLLAIKHSKFGTDNYILKLDIPILIFDNLNSIFLIIVYFVLTRGRELTSTQARIQAVKITLSFAVAYGALYLLFQQRSNFAYEIHRTCSLCVAVFTPVLVGWSFNLRFKTSIVLMVGCLYGLTQPIVYATQLRTLQPDDFNKTLTDIQPIVAMIVGFLKVMWAITCTKVLSSAHASSENLVLVKQAGQSDFWRGWSFAVGLHATILIAVYCVLLIVLAHRFLDKLGGFATSIGVVTGVFSLWQTIWNFWKTTRKK